MSSEFLPLPMAAAVAYMRLVHPAQREEASGGLLDVVATALAVWVPIYGGEPRARLEDSVLARGRFCNGATCLRFRDGAAPIEHLAILQCDLEAGIRRLGRAGVRFSDAMIEQAPRRVPRVLPPTA